MSRRVLYTAAHGGFERGVPLGGGAAVYEHLIEEWARTKPFPLQTITPAVLGAKAPAGADLVNFSNSDYARFCREFERAATAEILRHDPGEAIVLVNDVSEGPDFRVLGSRGYRTFTIYHVDVVAYIATLYGRGLVSPEATVRWYRRAAPLLPDIARLIWEKQEASVRWSQGLIVPSQGMRDVLLRCYPDCPPEKIHVIPWGNWNSTEPGDPLPVRREFGVPDDAHVLLALSRISPEKGQDLLLEALIDWERRGNLPERPLWAFICGEPAYMHGHTFMRKLRALASRLKRTRVVFPGHVLGERKRSFFALADLYIFPSRYEAYGLTLIEALAAGVPVVCLDTPGARSVVGEEFGALVRQAELYPAIRALLKDEPRRRAMSAAARTYAARDLFPDRAAQLAALLA